MKIAYVLLAISIAALVGCNHEVKSESSSSQEVSSSSADSVKVDTAKVGAVKSDSTVKADTAAKK